MLLILKSDIKQGCKSNLIKYAAVLFFAIVSTFYFNRVLGIMCRDGLAEQVGILDVLVYLVGGVNPMNEGDKNFEIPIMWMSMRLLVCSCIFIYPIKDLYGRGMTVLLKYGSKTKWWLSKCIWTVMQVFIVYSIFYAGVIATSYGLGIDKWTYSATIGARMSGARIVDQTNLILLVFALPVIYALIMALIEINLSLFMEPIFSLLAVVVYDVLSTCVMTPLLLGNISMVLRIKGVASRGIGLNEPLVAGIVLAVLSVVLGLKYIKRKDILGVD